MVDQVARVLRPGGLFLAGEWGRSAEMAGGMNPAEHAPRTCHFYRMVQETLLRRDIRPIARHIPRIMEESGHFKRVKARVYEMPVGPWHSNPELQSIGFWYRETLVRYAQSMGLMMVEAGCDPAQVQDVVYGFIREMYEVRGLVCKYFTVRAIKVRV